MRAASRMLYNMNSKGKLTLEKEKPFIYTHFLISFLSRVGDETGRQDRSFLLSSVLLPRRRKNFFTWPPGAKGELPRPFVVGISMVRKIECIGYLLSRDLGKVACVRVLSCIGTQPHTCTYSSLWDSCNESCVRWLLGFESFCPSMFMLSIVSSPVQLCSGGT